MLKKMALLGGLALMSGSAMAHSGHATGSGLLAGLAHPPAGLDHLLAALAIGLLASRESGVARWRLPLLFTLTLAVGVAAAGLFSASFFELAILASLFVFAALLLSGPSRVATPLLLTLVGAFALFHGAAHGSEAPVGAGIAYLAGLLLATFSLHAGGLLLGARMSSMMLRLSGLVLGGSGLLLAMS